MTERIVVLTAGEYSNYGLEGVYRTSKTDEEFKAILDERAEIVKKARSQADAQNQIAWDLAAVGTTWDLSKAQPEFEKARELLDKAKAELEPLHEFLRRNGIEPVEYEELWWDSGYMSEEFEIR